MNQGEFKTAGVFWIPAVIRIEASDWISIIFVKLCPQFLLNQWVYQQKKPQK